MKVEDRLLKYVSYWTTSDEENTNIPSSDRQFELGKELKKELEEDCKKIVKEKMFVRAVAEKEGIKYSEEEAKKYAAISGYTSVEEFEEYLNYYGEELEYTVLSYQVQNFISEHINVVPDEETTAEEAAATEETTTAAPEETTETETAAE